MYSISRWFTVVVLFILVGSFASAAAYAVTVDGYCYLEGESDHSGTRVEFRRYPLGEITFDTYTISSGYYNSGSHAFGWYYDVIYSHTGFLPDTLVHIWIPASQNTTLPPVTLHRGLCGSLSGTLGPGDWPVVCNISVEAGNTLRILPGAHLLFEGDYDFIISGSLRAVGTLENPVVFTRRYPTEESRWGGIGFYSTYPCSLKYSRIEYASVGNWGGVFCFDGSPIISHCVISNNSIGIYFSGNADVSLINCTVSRNSDYGIASPASEFPTWHLTSVNNIIDGNTNGSVASIPACFSATYCEIEGGGWDGEGNIDCSPLFEDPANGDFHITWDNFPTPDETKSCCIDSGDPDSPKDPDGTRADIGAFYFHQPFMWITWDQSGPGRPTDIEVVSCDINSTRLRIVSHGMYVERVIVEADTFWKYSLPQTDGGATVYATTQDTGKCELPRITRLIGLPTDVSPVTMTMDSIESVYLSDRYVTYPYQRPLYDVEPDTFTFYWDSLFYLSDALYPYDPYYPPALEFQARWFHHLKVVPFTVYPIYSIPCSGQVLVAKRMSVTLHHAGVPIGYDTLNITRLYDNIYGGSTINWGCIKDLFLGFLPWRNAKYLIIYADQYIDEMLPLVIWKMEKGLDVRLVPVSTIGNSCDSIKNYITNFYNACKCCDIFVLLVGDQDEVATCKYKGGDSDYKYACVKGDDPYPDLFIGRLSPESEQNLSVIVSKILNREWTIPGGDWYEKVLLVAHKQKEYRDCKEQIRTYDYFWRTPTFDTCYGGSGADNNCVTNAINDGRNIVNYRGHGSETEWWHWASDGSSWTINDVNGLANDGMAPIVFSISCSNSDISYNECIGEKWLQVANKGAVAHYGASVGSWTKPNHDLDKYLFKAIYDTSRIRVLGPAVNWAQAKTITLWKEETHSYLAEDNAWIYILLGDPEMHIRTIRKGFSPLVGQYVFGRKPFSGTVLDTAGVPVKDALVTMYDSSTSQNPNFYTDSAGNFEVSFSTNPMSDSITVCITEPDFEPYWTKVLAAKRGDVNCDGKIDATDVVYLINYLFVPDSPEPVPLEAGDVNCDGKVDVNDVVYLINYLFVAGSPPPCDP